MAEREFPNWASIGNSLGVGDPALWHWRHLIAAKGFKTPRKKIRELYLLLYTSYVPEKVYKKYLN